MQLPSEVFDQPLAARFCSYGASVRAPLDAQAGGRRVEERELLPHRKGDDLGRPDARVPPRERRVLPTHPNAQAITSRFARAAVM
eukprot:4896645-Prymnesium_polylepis.1